MPSLYLNFISSALSASLFQYDAIVISFRARVASLRYPSCLTSTPSQCFSTFEWNLPTMFAVPTPDRRTSSVVFKIALVISKQATKS